jgi:hypothetical protein
MTKEIVLMGLVGLPDEFAAEELIERLVLLEKIANGLKDVDGGRTISFEESYQRMQVKWKGKGSNG